MLVLAMSMVMCVNAEENVSYVNVTEVDTISENISSLPQPFVSSIDNPQFGIKRIEQGQCVEIGQTYDISGIGWWSGYIGYYGRYTDDFSPTNVSLVTVKQVPYNLKKLSNFEIDSSFEDYPGYWYNMPDNGFNRAANERLFYVSDHCIVTANVSAAIVREAINASQARQLLLANMSQLPIRTEEFTDIIISKNTTTYLESPPFSRYWIFGHHNTDLTYDLPLERDNVTALTTELTNSLSEGRYDVIFTLPGKNEINEEPYDRHLQTISSPFRIQNDVPLRGIQPFVAEEKLIDRISSSYDDSYVKWRMLLQDPKIEISYLRQEPLTNNQSFIMLKGYTNANPDTPLTIRIDANRTTGESYTLNTTQAYAVFNGGMAAYRTWNTTFIVDFNNVYPGYHDLTVTTDNGATAIVPIFIRQELPAHYTPPTFLKFIDNSPFIEPVIVEKEVIKEVPKIVTERVIVREEVDYAKLSETVFWRYAPLVIGGILAVLLGLYMVSVVSRTYERRKRNRESKED